MQLLIIKDWILKELSETEEVKKELSKDNWHYRLTTASLNYTLIDYDKDLARPYVKALLAKVNKLKEVKMLWWVLFILIFTYISFLSLFFIWFFKVLDVEKSLLKTSEQLKNNTKIEETISNISRNRAFDSVETPLINSGAESKKDRLFQ